MHDVFLTWETGKFSCEHLGFMCRAGIFLPSLSVRMDKFIHIRKRLVPYVNKMFCYWNGLAGLQESSNII